MKSIRNSKGLYWGLIITFFVLYFLVGFVSTLHSITFFELANVMWMAVLLGITYEVGQAAVLFSILMSDNNKKLLPWLLMFLLTALQVTANVYASFKFMDSSGSNDWTFWQRSILFWLEADGPEMFKVVISWITGALLPVVALGMTALVAENLKLKDEQEQKRLNGEDEEESLADGVKDNELKKDSDIKYDFSDMPSGEINDFDELEDKGLELEDDEIKTFDEKRKEQDINWEGEQELEEMLNLQDNLEQNKNQPPIHMGEVLNDLAERSSQLEEENYADDLVNITKDPNTNEVKAEIVEEPFEFKEGDGIVQDKEEEIKRGQEKITKRPANVQRGWHLRKEHIDTNGDVYKYGIYQPGEKRTPPENESLKKA